MAAYLSPLFGAGAQLFSNQGIVLSGGKIYTYQAGTTTAQTTWTDSTQVVANANPLILDSAGRPTTEIWLLSGQPYKFILTDSNNNTLGTWDNVSGVNDVSFTAAVSEWQSSSLTPTYISSTSFSVPGNNVAMFQTNRRVQITVTAGTIYGYVVSSTYSTVTTVVIQPDSTTLDSGISVVNVGLLTVTHPSVPQEYLAMNAPLTVASAATTLIGAALSASVTVSGVVTITAFDNVVAGILRFVKFSGILTLTHNGTSLIFPGSANITTAANDEAVFRSLGSGNWECLSYSRASGYADYATNATNLIRSAITAGTKYIPFFSIIGTAAGGTASPNGTSAVNATSFYELFNSVIFIAGTYRVSFLLAIANATATAHGRIYKNGVAFGTERTTNSISYVQFTEDLTFAAGDTLQLYCYTTNGTYAANMAEAKVGVANRPVFTEIESLMVGER
jgi:hypothetical protein